MKVKIFPPYAKGIPQFLALLYTDALNNCTNHSQAKTFDFDGLQRPIEDPCKPQHNGLWLSQSPLLGIKELWSFLCLQANSHKVAKIRNHPKSP